MATVLEVATALSQIMSLAHDGALDENDEPVKIGLKREEGEPLIDSRVIDGFKIKHQDNKLIINYQCELTSKEMHEKKFDEDVRYTVGEVVKFLKKEYKKITGDALSLTEIGDPKIEAYETSRVRRWLQAECVYEIENIKAEKVEDGEELLEKETTDWLGLGKNQTKAFR